MLSSCQRGAGYFSIQFSTFLLEPGVGSVDNPITFKSGDKVADLRITKIEDVFFRYKLEIRFNGYKNGIARWNFRINNGNPLKYFDSQKVIFAPYGGKDEAIKITETDSKGTSTCYVNLTKEPHETSRIPPDSPISKFLEKGQKFKPEDGKDVKFVFSNEEVVVLYARSPGEWDTSIYVARANDHDFQKCKIKMESVDIKDPYRLCVISITIGEEQESHELKFPQAPKETYNSDLSWNGSECRGIIMPEKK